jgi:hypothetical protein
MSIKLRLPHRHVSDFCEVQSDESEAVAVYMARVTQAAISAMSALRFHAPIRNTAQRIRVWVLRDDAAMKRAFPAYPKSHAYSHAGQVAVRGVPECIYETRRRLLHELGHVVQCRANLKVLTGRLKDGFADLFSLHHWDGKTLVVKQITGVGESKMMEHAAKLHPWIKRGLDLATPLRQDTLI